MSSGEFETNVEELRNRFSKLSSACMRISASLDLSTVLNEIVDAARELTGARLGAITTVDDSGRPQDFVTSGLTPDEHLQMESWADGPRLFEHFRSLPGPLRIPDLGAYLDSFGFSPDWPTWTSFQGTPIRYGGVDVGNFFLSDKDGGQEFTSEDEELLLLFASQAANAVVNARRHQAEQRARADIEALVNTSPVGVVVFDAPTGRPKSVNEEARRILDGLRTPGHAIEELEDQLIVKRADGQEYALSKLPLPEVLRSAAPVRAEEVVVRVPDGRSVTMLINATPIRADDGEVASLVVTLQDLSPLKGLDRLRADFLGMVSHELRVPLTSIKGSATTVLGAPAGLEPAEMMQFFRIIEQQANHMAGLVSDLLDVGRIETGSLSVYPEPSDVASLVDEARNTFLSGGGRHTVEIDLPLDLPWVRADKRRVIQVLNNLISNSSKHSPETSPIRVTAKQDGIFMEFSVTDEGRGVPPDRLPQMFRKYQSSGGDDAAVGIQGAGLGLAICKGLVEAHGGRIWAESEGLGQGTRISFTVPVAEATVARPAARSVTHPSVREPDPVLVIDDDPETLRYVRDAVTRAGFSVVVTGNPEEVSSLIKRRRPQLVLLDLILPGTDGIELMDRVPALADIPVIFISGYGRDETIARALQKGAADYIVKPFSPTELVARIEAALRSKNTQPEPFRVGDLRINYAEREVTVSGRPVELTATEFNLLRELSIKAGRVLTYDTLLGTVWGKKNTADARVVRSFVKKVRRKLDDSTAKPKYIFTVHRVGYRMAKPSQE